MNGQRWFKAVLVAGALMLAVPAGAQTVSTSDIQRLQDDVYQASSDISRLRSTDASTASRLQDELDDLRDEVTYLKVKLRKEGNISRSDYTDVRERLQTLRSRAHGDSSQGRPGSSSSLRLRRVRPVRAAAVSLTIDRERAGGTSGRFRTVRRSTFAWSAS